MECPACGPSKDYDLLLSCDRCGRSYCQDHAKDHGHRENEFQGATISGADLMEQFARSIQQQMQNRREPTKDEYEAFLRQNDRILTTGRESLDLLLGMILIAWVFGNIALRGGGRTWEYVVVLTLIIGPAFILHELAHKFMAIKYGKYARFTLIRQMAFFTLIAGALRWPIAGPGATMILGSSTEEESGIFSAVGPATNFLLAVISYMLFLVTPANLFISQIGETLGWVFLLSTFINGVLGVFNMLPFGAFDGKKILNWNTFWWVGLILLNAPMVYLGYPATSV